MSILMERMLTHWLTHITSSPCSRLVSYCVQLFSTRHLSSSPSDMVSKLTQLHRLTSHTYESALTPPPPSRPRLHLTLGHSHKMATSFATRDCSMSPMIRTSNWTSSTLITTIAWLDTLASPRQSRTSVVSSIGPEWSLSSLTTSTHVRCAVAASPSIISPLALIVSSQSANDHGTQSRWTSSRGYPCLMGMTQSWW